MRDRARFRARMFRGVWFCFSNFLINSAVLRRGHRGLAPDRRPGHRGVGEVTVGPLCPGQPGAALWYQVSPPDVGPRLRPAGEEVRPEVG